MRGLPRKFHGLQPERKTRALSCIVEMCFLKCTIRISTVSPCKKYHNKKLLSIVNAAACYCKSCTGVFVIQNRLSNCYIILDELTAFELNNFDCSTEQILFFFKVCR